MKKLIIKILSALMIFMVTVSNVSALTEEICPFYHEISSIIPLEKGPILILNSKANETYWQFKDVDNAFKEIKELENDYILELKNYYQLNEFIYKNWREYSNALESYIYNGIWGDSIENIVRLKTFFNICDNQTLNEEINVLYSTDDYTMEELAILLPYTSPYYKEYASKPKISTYATMNVANAVAYASKWANSYNYSYVCHINADCTNFASQIARAGGIGNRSNWYYNSVNDHSTSWIRADTFVKTWGTSYSTTNFRNLSENVSKGKFIAHDSDADGKWNHVGFVTATSNSYKATNGVTYKDFQVAQHTKNYEAWVSSSTNGWETVGGVKAVINTPN